MRAGGLALVSLGLDPLWLARTAYAVRRRPVSAAADRPVLVCLFQRGAVDGLSMVVPFTDSAYYRARPRIAIPAKAVLPLDGRFGLHPALASLKPLWDQRALAVVHAVGSPAATRSHFEAQDNIETGTPGIRATRDGWLNRYLSHRAEHRETPFRSVALGPELPRLLAGQAPGLAIGDLAALGTFDATPATALVAASPREHTEAVQILRGVQPWSYSPANGAEYPVGPLGRSLLQIVQLIKADVGLEIAFADVGGWDTHYDQGGCEGRLAARLHDLAKGVAAFCRDLGDRMERVVMLTMSEFGRTVQENGSAGTDHGHGTAMLVLGGPVHGGNVLGKWTGLEGPSLFDGRDLAVTTDFRDLFGEIAVRHLGAADLGPVFPGYDVTADRFPGVLRG